MKVLSYRPDLASRRGAFECQSLIYDYLQKKYGFEFTILTSEDNEYCDSRFNIIKIPRVYWAPFRGRHFFINQNRKLAYLEKYLTNIDLLLTADPTVYPQSHLAFELASRLDIPIWFDASITLLSEAIFFRSNRYAFRRVKRSLNIATGTFITVPKCIERFQHLRLIDETNAHKFHLLGHPVDTELFKPNTTSRETSGKLTILCVSRLVPEKGLIYIIEAFSILAHRYPHIHLQLLGEGLLRSALEYLVQNRGLSDRVTFINTVSHDHLSVILQKADIFVNHAISTPEWEEYFGATNLEAMACGLSCVLSSSGSIPYVIRDSTAAIFTPERDVKELIDALDRLILDEELRQSLSNRARSYVEQVYSLPIIAERFLNLITSN